MLTRPPSAGWCKTSNATVISFGSGPLVLAALRRTMPDRERPFRVWGGDAIPLLAFYSANMRDSAARLLQRQHDRVLGRTSRQKKRQR